MLTLCIGLLIGFSAQASAASWPGEASACRELQAMTDTAKLAPPFDEVMPSRDSLFIADDIIDFEPDEDAPKAKKRKRSKADKMLKAGADTTKVKKLRRGMEGWKPDPKRAMWLAIVIPGAGQIYNGKYWKLPIVYGGFLGCAYAMRWNNQQYHDYSQAFNDLMDDDPTTQSYNQFLHLNNRINDQNKNQWSKIFKRRKDYYRRYRDMSFFIMVGVYAISVIDAYVDASLAQFDISDDLSLKVEPTVISGGMAGNSNSLALQNLRSAGLGVQCSINF